VINIILTYLYLNFIFKIDYLQNHILIIITFVLKNARIKKNYTVQ